MSKKVIIENLEKELMLQGAPIMERSEYFITAIESYIEDEVEQIDKQQDKIVLQSSFGGNYNYDGSEGKWEMKKQTVREYTSFVDFEKAGYFDDLENRVIKMVGKKW